nr:retrovirus-related Pol polyprotein from transposon TNT 1-94 [Tanacetum cinerariifolium]
FWGVKFWNDQIAPILGYGDLVQGAVTIKRVYYVEGLNHNLFSVGQFCDADLEVAFRKSTCFIRDLKGNDLLTGSCGTNLYSITLQDTNSPNPICLMAKATLSQAWLWHRCLSHLNFDIINLLSRNDIVVGLPKLKFIKDHLCSSCELGKAKRKSFHSKLTPSSKTLLHLLHIDLCGPMRVASINGKRYVLVIVNDYSRYTWTHFLRSKDETPDIIIDFLRLIKRGLQAQVKVVRTNKGTEFLNQTLYAYFAVERIKHQTPVARTPEQNGVVKRRNRSLVEAARTMLSAAKVPLFFWAEAIATACFTQNRSLVIPHHEKTPYHIINNRKPSVKFFHIFGSTMALEHQSLSPGRTCQENVSHGDKIVTRLNELDLLFSPMFDELLNGPSQVVSKSSTVLTADESIQRQLQQTTPLVNHTTPDQSCRVQSHESTVTSNENINQAELKAENDQVADDKFINIFSTLVQERGETSSRHVYLSNMHTFYQRYPSEHRWTKDHPLNKSLEILHNLLELDDN